MFRVIPGTKSHPQVSRLDSPKSPKVLGALAAKKHSVLRSECPRGLEGQRFWNAREDVETKSLSDLLKVTQAEIPSPAPFGFIFYFSYAGVTLYCPQKCMVITAELIFFFKILHP